MNTHIMLDLKTLGTGNNACLLSIGAVKFDPTKISRELDRRNTLESFHVHIDPATCQQFGMTVDASTVMWWMDDQRSAARSHLMAHDRVDIGSVLDGFSRWFGDESLPVWGNGATFDNVILRNAYTALGLECPWKFYHDRCYRTLKNTFAAIPQDAFQGTQHDALADALHQTEHLGKIAYIHSLILS